MTQISEIYYGEWESINKTTRRMAVPGGWLVLHGTSAYRASPSGSSSLARSESMVFPPDSRHKWEICAPKPSNTVKRLLTQDETLHASETKRENS